MRRNSCEFSLILHRVHLLGIKLQLGVKQLNGCFTVAIYSKVQIIKFNGYFFNLFFYLFLTVFIHDVFGRFGWILRMRNIYDPISLIRHRTNNTETFNDVHIEKEHKVRRNAGAADDSRMYQWPFMAKPQRGVRLTHR